MRYRPGIGAYQNIRSVVRCDLRILYRHSDPAFRADRRSDHAQFRRKFRAYHLRLRLRASGRPQLLLLAAQRGNDTQYACFGRDSHRHLPDRRIPRDNGRIAARYGRHPLRSRDQHPRIGSSPTDAQTDEPQRPVVLSGRDGARMRRNLSVRRSRCHLSIGSPAQTVLQ